MAWIVSTNSNTCYIYDYTKKPAKLTLEKQIQHPENKLRDTELTSDKPGRYAFGAYEQESDPKEIKRDSFAREIAKELDAGRTGNHYDKLIVIAAPHMYGLLTSHLNEHVKKLISHHVQKDLLHFSERELLEFLQENTQYPGTS